jgi:hypothetical protein
VFAVALTELAGTVEAESAALAHELGVTAYEARLRLAPGLPAVLLHTPDRERALRLLAGVRGRGHGAVACDEAAVTPLHAMVSIRDFRIENGELLVLGTHGEAIDRVAFGDVLTLIRLLHRRVEVTTTVEKKKSFAPGRALLTGGVLHSKTKEREVTTQSEEREQALVLHRRVGKPLVLRETAAHYDGLGAERSVTTLQNFARFVERIRREAPRASFDDRLVQRKPREGDGGIDLVVHLLALSLAKRAAPRG